MRRPASLLIALLMATTPALAPSAVSPAEAASDTASDTASVTGVSVRVGLTYGTWAYLGEPAPYDVEVRDVSGELVAREVTVTASGGAVSAPTTVTSSTSGPTRVTVVPSADEMTVTATVSSTDGSPGAQSSETTLVHHRFTVPPVALVSGAPVVGAVLSAAPAGGAPAPDQTDYRWLVGYTNEPFGGRLSGFGPSYTVREADVGQPIRLMVLVQRSYYDAVTVVSAPTAPVLRRATRFGVSAPTTAVAGRRIRVSVAAVAPGESVTVYLGGRLVGRTVGGPGLPRLRVKVPRRFAGSTRSLTVRSAQADRSGSVRIMILPRR